MKELTDEQLQAKIKEVEHYLKMLLRESRRRIYK